MAILGTHRAFELDDPRLQPLLVPRLPDTPEHARVRQFIVHHYETLGWHVELDSFQDETPFGKKTITNVIVTHNPKAKRRLVLSAHYESKYFKDFEFIGATDSAVPCAIMMDIAQTLNPFLAKGKDHITLQMVFFDAEEAFVEWTAEDSLYGSRHLAEKWEKTNQLDSIDVMVLFDLLGFREAQITNYFQETSILYHRLEMLASRLAKQDLLETHSTKEDGQSLGSFFNSSSFLAFKGHYLEDDHQPFSQRGVNILYIFGYPDPYHHTVQDNASIIDPSVVRNLAILFRCFVLEYLGTTIK
ncbi:hypothetical protein BDA99DRAFT_532685 [Phascolomyces articulosus]|uniref:Peptide hydrolase n=1 Tax=Phascolomyces articulosus TaxID=60185 RepID=A0AAD5K9M3_9FUNG|nr:hypothetical protein BDA99DRAFT_532685 [Phascolomyces articulosus]